MECENKLSKTSPNIRRALMHIRLADVALFHAGKLAGALLKLFVTNDQRKRSFVRQTQIT
jgi:hypothetical protein